MEQRLSMSSLIGILRRPGFWLLVALLTIITIPHYGNALEHPAFLVQLVANFGLDRHAVERIAYLMPIIWAGFLFGWKGAVVTSIAALACMLPRAILISPFPRDALFETSAVFIVGNLVAFSFGGLRKERGYRIQLAALNQTSSVVSQSLELSQILNSCVDNIINVMSVDAALIFLLDEEAGHLTLAAHQGVSEAFVGSVGRIKMGEGLNGAVAQTGEPMLVKDASKDARVTKIVAREENMRSQLIAPGKSKGKVMGTICVGVRGQREFRRDEVELLTAIGNQLGVAVDNARLYEQEREVAEQLRASEERYRLLFENAHDAIWVHDLEQNIIAANRSFVRLTGYALEELRGIRAGDLIAEGCTESLGDIEDPALRGEAIGRLSQVTMIQKDRSEAAVQLSTSPVFSDGQLVAFQHVARDVTQEKRMQENLRFYLGQLTKAQEEERKRIARELHDDTIQALIVLSRQLDGIASTGKGLAGDKRLLLENLLQQTDNIMEGLRRLSQDLRPPTLERLGLVPAVKSLASDVEKRSGIPAEVEVRGAERRLPAEVELLLFRVTQEALRNVERHSEARKAKVVLGFQEGRTRITIKDDGKGFHPPEMMGDLAKDGRLGLVGMQERVGLLGGSLKVESGRGQGTTVVIEAPM